MTCKLFDQPYSISTYIQRAVCHECLGYSDLAASDAYKALLLTDELDGGEYEAEVREALQSTELESIGNDQQWDGLDGMSPQEFRLVRGLTSEAYTILIRTLAECSDIESARDFAERGCDSFPESLSLRQMKNQLFEANASCTNGTGRSRVSSVKHPLIIHRQGTASARREIYPWNDHEPDRFSEEIMSAINSDLETCAPKCKVVAVNLPLLTQPKDHAAIADSVNNSHKQIVKQLGIFAKEDILPGEIVLVEPSILTVNNRLLEPLCDACSSVLPDLSSSSEVFSCSNCSDTYFCSKICHDRAQDLYHPAICGIDEYEIMAKDPPRAAATDALYVLLVARVIAMAETQDVHPLRLAQVRYLWGDFSPSPGLVQRELPFRFQANIAQPLHILTNLGLDIFSPGILTKYDTWVVNTLLAKFRGVASAKINARTLQPDVAAVHPLWSLANHSCAPNVRWEWGAEESIFKGQEKGAMGFAARAGHEIIQWGQKAREGGIQKDSEVLNHYCDLKMDLRERREWAAGALGGQCRCDRCIWEETNGL